ncbi:MAG: PAS domain-containing sensor histidine kinase [Sphingomonadaceae bacterium]
MLDPAVRAREPLTKEDGWSAETSRQGRFMTSLEVVLAAAAAAIGLMSYAILTRGQVPATGLSPSLVTGLLIVNLVPLMALLVLIARRVALLLANRRAGLTGASLHVRLVALFAALAAIPTILVVVFASLLFQFGVQFWFSDRARTVLDNADRVAQAYVQENKARILDDIIAMGGDLSGYASEYGLPSEQFSEGLAFQVAARNLSEAAVFTVNGNGPRIIAAVGLAGAPLAERLVGIELGDLEAGSAVVVGAARDRVEAIVPIEGQGPLFVYVSRKVEARVLEQVARTQSALSDYTALTERSRVLQWRFNLILLFVSLMIVAVAIWLALWLASRIVTPLRHVTEAAERVGAGDFDVRVEPEGGGEEVRTLARAFNRMTGQIEGQQTALKAATLEAERRRRFIEAILSGVSAGVLALDGDGRIRLANRSAIQLLGLDRLLLVGRPLADVSPELAGLLDQARSDGTAQGEVVRILGDTTQTLAVQLTADPGEGRGYILTFDDITQQLADQRRAAWSDVARRIAHEIKNPLTPIVLSAERLQRRFASQVTEGRETFDNLTATIIRQVSDLRRMVDEFSAFARMPGPTFREEDIVEIARQAVFLAQVAAPGVRFQLRADSPSIPFVCDRRQLGQAFTNLLKNAIEAIQGCQEGEGAGDEVALTIHVEGDRLLVTIADTGCGLPADLRDRLFEPYVTTRQRGTGLGLAIVKRIVEDHRGRLDLLPGQSGDTARPGAVARMEFSLGATRELLDRPAEAPAQAMEAG